MHLSPVDYVLWILGFTCQVSVASVMLRGGTFRRFPVFFTWLIFEASKSVVLFAIFHSLGYGSYYFAYWRMRLVGDVIGLAILIELFSHLIDSRSYRIREWLLTLTLICGMGLFCSFYSQAAIIKQVKIVAAVEEMTSMIRCTLFLIICAAAHLFGLRWRHHAIAIASGFGIFTASQLLFSAFLAKYGRGAHGLQYAVPASFLFASALWFQTLKKSEPERLSRMQIELALGLIHAVLRRETNATSKMLEGYQK